MIASQFSLAIACMLEGFGMLFLLIKETEAQSDPLYKSYDILN